MSCRFVVIRVDKQAEIIYIKSMGKLTFGQFLAECRTKKRLTQKELADKLFVGESAVSKWEKDKRRPDLELVTRLSEIFGITESELIKASVDETRIKEKKQARNFRVINNVYNLILIIGFGIALLTCFIVNLAVSHTLSWFFLVLCAIILAATILILPQYIKKYKLVIIPLSWLLSLYLLLGICAIYTKGNWFFVPMFALLLAYSIIFTPLLIKAYLPRIMKKHNALFSITINAVVLFFMLVVIDLYTLQNDINAFGWSFTKGLPIMLFWLVPIFVTILILQYVKMNWTFKTSSIIAIWIVLYNIFYVALLGLGIENTNGRFWQANLLKWSNETLISANVILLVDFVALISVICFAVLGCMFWRRNKRK